MSMNLLFGKYQMSNISFLYEIFACPKKIFSINRTIWLYTQHSRLLNMGHLKWLIFIPFPCVGLSKTYGKMEKGLFLQACNTGSGRCPGEAFVRRVLISYEFERNIQCMKGKIFRHKSRESVLSHNLWPT